MKERTYIKELQDKKDKEVIIAGWMAKKRKLSNVIFLILRDMTGNIQCVVDKKQEKLFELAKTITTESVLKITGVMKQRDWDFWERLKSYTMIEGTSSTPLGIDGVWYEDNNETFRAEFGWAEIQVSDIEILAVANPLPFSLEEKRPNRLKAIQKILEIY